MGRKLLNRETYLQPAEWAEGYVSMHLCVTLDADAGDPASLLAASLLATQLQHVWGRFTCTPFCDPETHHVRLTLHADFKDENESEWSEGLCERMEELWEEDGGVEDYGRALEYVKEDILTELQNWLEGRAEDLDYNLVPKIHVSVHDFHIWQE